MAPITNLQYTDTFKTWFDTTNTVISTLNGVTVYNILAGDGIGVSSSNNIFTINHGTNVATGVTFAGNVIFSGTVSFASSPTVSSTTINFTPKTTGLTAGNVVRINGTGLTLAKADSTTNAEVFGMVVGEDASSNIVAVSGVVNNTNYANTIANALGIVGGTLIAGQAYFLSPSVAGGITINEPQTYGQVSKPIILGITGGAGSLLTYRGIQIEGISAGITAELDNKIVIQLTVSGGSGATLKPGDPVLYFADSSEFIDENGISDVFKTYGKLNNSTYSVCGVPDFSGFAYPNYLTEKYFLGLLSKVIVDAGSSYILEVTLPGGSFNSLIADLDTNFFTATTITQPLDLNTSGKLVAATSTNKFVDFIKTDSSNAKIIIAPKGSGTSSSAYSFIGAGAISVSGATASLEYDNLVPNGSFAIWQRQITGLTASGLNTYSTPFADRWFVVKNNPTGLTANLSRQDFASDQVSVPGSPLYYTNVNTQFSGITGLENRLRLENVQKEARLLQNQQTTISFWAKSTVSGSTLDVIYNRYKDSYANSSAVETDLNSRVRVSTPSGITLTTSWQEYVYSFTPTVAGFTLGATGSGWFAVGFEFPSSTATVSLAQVKLESGDSVSPAIYMPPEKELERCKPYYLRTYDWDQTTGFTGTSRLNEEYVQLGNLQTQKNYLVKFPVETVEDPTVYLYSPSTGQTGDAFNENTGKDMRYSGDGLVNLPWDNSTSRTTSAWPTPNITVTSATKNGMTVNISNGATHLDTLKFHYVADADLNLNV